MSLDIRERALARAREKVREIDVETAHRELADGRVLIDVREQAETCLGMPEGAICIPRSSLELSIAEHAAYAEAPLALICGSGARSVLAALSLKDLGFSDVCSVSGGYDAWKAAGLPVNRSEADPDWNERYSRHLKLSEVGVQGQQRLQRASVLVIGAGGLGSPALLYLAAAGVGQISIVDDDRVERSNLQRQVVHGEARVGMQKSESARLALLALNPRIRINAINQRLGDSNVDALISAHDIIIDGSDNLATRYRVSDACVKHGRPMVFAAVHRFEGQVAVFDAGRRRGESPCYRCLFPAPPSAEFAPNCSEIGVLGVTPGVMGLLQANETLKLILEIGSSLDGRLLSIDLLNMQFRETRLRPDPQCPACGAEATGEGLEVSTPVCAAGDSD